MRTLFIIYLITVVLGALGEFFMYAQIKDTIKSHNYVQIRNIPFLLRIANVLKLCIMALLPLYNIILFIAGLIFTEEKCIESIEKAKTYVKKNE